MAINNRVEDKFNFNSSKGDVPYSDSFTEKGMRLVRARGFYENGLVQHDRTRGDANNCYVLVTNSGGAGKILAYTWNGDNWDHNIEASYENFDLALSMFVENY